MKKIDYELEQKKELLKKEVMDTGINLDEFINYCVSKKEDGDNLNNWTIDELKTIIKEFTEINAEKKEKEKKNNEEEIKPENLENLEKVDPNKEENKRLNMKIMLD